MCVCVCYTDKKLYVDLQELGKNELTSQSVQKGSDRLMSWDEQHPRI